MGPGVVRKATIEYRVSLSSGRDSAAKQIRYQVGVSY